MQPRREYQLWRSKQRRVLVASDAAYEDGVVRAGFLIIANPGAPDESREGREVIIPPSIYAFWGHCETYIAQLELLVVLCAMLEFPEHVRGSQGFWFVDNVAALMALVKGKSDKPSVDKMDQFVHLANFAFGSVPYFEYIESAANWSDEISKVGLKGHWAQQKCFRLCTCTFICQLLLLPPAPLVTIFTFL